MTKEGNWWVFCWISFLIIIIIVFNVVMFKLKTKLLYLYVEI